MDSPAIGSTTSAGVAASAQAFEQRAQGSSMTKAETTGVTQHLQTTDSPHAKVRIPQRDPRSVRYQVDGATHRVVASIVDEGSKTVVREIPDAELLRIAQAIDRMQGFLVEEKA